MAGHGTIGAKIVLEGEKQYKQALKDIKQAQAQLRSEMRLCSSEFKNSQNSLDALQKKHQILSKQVDTSAQKVKVYEQALESSQAKEKKAADDLDKARKAYEDASKAMEEMAKSGEHTEDELKAQEEVIGKLKDKLSVAEKNYSKATEQTTRYQTALNNANVELNEANAELKLNDKYMEEAEKSTEGTAKSIDEFGNSVKEASEQTNVFGDVLKANLTSTAIIAAVKEIATAMVEMASACVETGMEFEASMSKVQALSGATGSELEALSDKAKEMGASTIFSASEAADAMGYMALAGWKVDQMLTGIEPILSLAASADMDLARASDIVTDSLTAFGLSAQDAEKFSDQMAYAMANSNTNVEQLGEAYKNCASAAASMNFSVEDVTSALMTMANAGVKGGEAGTSLRAIMVRLATDTKGCREELAKYGVEIADENGNLLSLSDIIYNVASAFEGLSDTEAASLAKTVAGQSQYTGLMTVLQGVSNAAEESGMSLESYADALATCDGYAKQMADTMQDNLKGKITILQSAMDGLKISMYETFDDSVKEVIDEAAKAVTRLNNAVRSGSLNVSLNRMGKSLGELAKRALELGEKSLPPMIDALTWVLDNAGPLASTILSVVSAMKAMSIVGKVAADFARYQAKVEGATFAQYALNSAMAVSPIGIFVVALAGLTAWSVAATRAAIDHAAALSDVGEASRNLASEQEALVNSSKKSAEAYEEQKVGFDVSAESAQALADKLMELNRNSDGSAASIAKQKAIIEQLNAIYPGLGLAIDEQTGALNQNSEALTNNIEKMKQKAKVDAAQERLTEIAKEQIEIQTKLIQSEEQVKDQKEKTAEAQQKVNDAWEEYTNALKNGPNAENEYQMWQIAVEHAAKEEEALESLTGSTEDATEQLNLLGQEEEALANQIGAAAEAGETAVESTDAMADSAQNAANSIENLKLSEEELEEFTKSVSSAIDGAVNAFEKWGEVTDTSSKELNENLDSQIEGLTQWANDFNELASKGVDDGLLKSLAEMGPEAEGYIRGLLSMTDEELANYSDRYAEAMRLKEETKATIIESYQTAGTEAFEAYNKGIEEAVSEATDNETMKEVGKQTTEQVAAGIEENTSVVTDSVTTMAGEVKTSMEESEMVDGAVDVGQMVDENLGDGIENNKDIPKGKAEAMASSIVDAVKQKLSTKVFFDIGMNLTKGLADGIAKGASDVLAQIDNIVQQANQKAANIKAPTVSAAGGGGASGGAKPNSVGGAGGGLVGNGVGLFSAGAMNAELEAIREQSIIQSDRQLDKLASTIQKGMEDLAGSTRDTNVQVVLEGDAQGVFRVVRQQNAVYKTTTGRSAFL